MSSTSRAVIPADERLQQLQELRCPVCDQPIAHEQITRVRQRMEEQKRRHARETEALLSQERANLEAKAETRIAAIEEAHATQLLAASEEATKKANQAMAGKIAEQEGNRVAAEKALAELKVSHQEQLNQRLVEQREALDQNTVKEVNRVRAESFEAKLKIEEKVAELQRQLQRKTSDELGEGAEVDLFEALKGEFPDDDITRVKKGEAGADIVHRVFDKGAACGVILYDSKNRKSWRNQYVDKLRNDQLAERADHSILTTNKFPAGARQIYIHKNVIVISPARALVMASVLRQHIIQLHGLRLSNESRDEKVSLLYELVTSEQFGQRLEQLDGLTHDLLDLDVREQKAHSATWNRRGDLVKSVQRSVGELGSEIDRIIGTSSTDVAAAG
jgi:hypothetical protein